MPIIGQDTHLGLFGLGLLGIVQYFVQFSQSLQGKDLIDPTHPPLNSYEQ